MKQNHKILLAIALVFIGLVIIGLLQDSSDVVERHGGGEAIRTWGQFRIFYGFGGIGHAGYNRGFGRGFNRGRDIYGSGGWNSVSWSVDDPRWANIQDWWNFDWFNYWQPGAGLAYGGKTCYPTNVDGIFNCFPDTKNWEVNDPRWANIQLVY